MSRTMHMRLAKLEQRASQHRTGDIPILCDDDGEFGEMVEQYLREGLIVMDDLPRCKPWWLVKDFAMGGPHEDRLELLS